MVLEFEDGNLRQDGSSVYEDGEEVALEQSTGLFVADQLVATSAILDGAASYTSMDQVLAALGIADTIVGSA
jgi:hypothetical protein